MTVKKKYYFLYITTNLVNGKYYKGLHATDDLFDGYLGSGKAFRRALHKYGSAAFKRRIVLFLPDFESLLQAEAMYITNEDLLNPNCYNLRGGGGGQPGHAVIPYERTEEQREAISRKARARYKKKLESGAKKYVYQPRPRKTPILHPSVSENHKGAGNPMYGRKGSQNPTAKAVYCVELDREFGSAMMAAEELHLAFQNISKVCQGKRRTCGGYHWCFLEDKDKLIEKYKELTTKDIYMGNKTLDTPDTGDNAGYLKPVIRVETEERFPSLTAAAKAVGLKSIKDLALRCKESAFYKGTHWMFLEDYERMTSAQLNPEETSCNSHSAESSD